MDTNIEILLEEYVMSENLIERHEIETKKLKEQKSEIEKKIEAHVLANRRSYHSENGAAVYENGKVSVRNLLHGG